MKMITWTAPRTAQSPCWREEKLTEARGRAVRRLELGHVLHRAIDHLGAGCGVLEELLTFRLEVPLAAQAVIDRFVPYYHCFLFSEGHVQLLLSTSLTRRLDARLGLAFERRRLLKRMAWLGGASSRRSGYEEEFPFLVLPRERRVDSAVGRVGPRAGRYRPRTVDDGGQRPPVGPAQEAPRAAAPSDLIFLIGPAEVEGQAPAGEPRRPAAEGEPELAPALPGGAAAVRRRE